jgi:hypothetical protein
LTFEDCVFGMDFNDVFWFDEAGEAAGVRIT